MTEHPACTVTVRADGSKCGREDVVYTFTASDGVTQFHECAGHYAQTGPTEMHARTGAGFQVGDRVVVRRHGKTYAATVSYVGAKGRVRATFTYNNGAERTVDVV